MSAQLWEYTVTTELYISREWLWWYGNYFSVKIYVHFLTKKKKGRKKLRIVCVQKSAAEVALGYFKKGITWFRTQPCQGHYRRHLIGAWKRGLVGGSCLRSLYISGKTMTEQLLCCCFCRVLPLCFTPLLSCPYSSLSFFEVKYLKWSRCVCLVTRW